MSKYYQLIHNDLNPNIIREKEALYAKLEITIAEFIPHRDNEYIKPLAKAIQELIWGENADRK